MNSCIYEGTIRHRRHYPHPNNFQYRLFLMYLDLDELPTLFSDYPLWSFEKPNLSWFRRADHFGDPALSLERSVRQLVRERTGRTIEGPIRMLTHLRYFGHCFNPATFYYCFDKTDTRLDTIVVEIHNTPWGEVFCYVLPEDLNEHPLEGWRRYRIEKRFHVSPFMAMDIRYDWRFRVPGEMIQIHMINYEGKIKLFDATLRLGRRPIHRKNLNRVLIQYPLITGKVIAMIYFQALRLVNKGVPVYTHPQKRR